MKIKIVGCKNLLRATPSMYALPWTDNGDQARQQAWAEPRVEHPQQHLAGRDARTAHVHQDSFCHSLFHNVTRRITKNLNSYLMFCLLFSKIHFKADIPVSCRSLAEKKVFESKSSYFERHFSSILIHTAKGYLHNFSPCSLQEFMSRLLLW